MKGALAVIDDAVLPAQLLDGAAEALRAAVENGCFFDFERPICAVHRTLLAALYPQKTLLALPVRYLPLAPDALPVLSCPKPCNDWRQFLRLTQQAHPNGWMLEVIPWSYYAPNRANIRHGGSLAQAVCEFRIEADALYYYDTGETLREKLRLAEMYGCRAAIGLESELSALGL